MMENNDLYTKKFVKITQFGINKSRSFSSLDDPLLEVLSIVLFRSCLCILTDKVAIYTTIITRTIFCPAKCSKQSWFFVFVPPDVMAKFMHDDKSWEPHLLQNKANFMTNTNCEVYMCRVHLRSLSTLVLLIAYLIFTGNWTALIGILKFNNRTHLINIFLGKSSFLLKCKKHKAHCLFHYKARTFCKRPFFCRKRFEIIGIGHSHTNSWKSWPWKGTYKFIQDLYLEWYCT